MINNRQKNFIIFFITKALFLGIGYSLILDITSNDSWLCFLLGSLLGLLFCFSIERILKNKKNYTLNEYLNKSKITGYIVNLLLITLSIILINEMLFVIQIFAKSFFLINSKTYLIVIPLFILIIYLSKYGYKVLAYLCECLFPINFVLIAFAFFALFYKVDLSNLKPFFISSNISFIKSTLFYFSLSTTPLILLLDLKLENNNITNSYIISSVVLTVICILLITILGPTIIRIYRFPEYMILKDISLFNFIEKVENIISISWIFDNFILLSFSTIFLKNRLNSNKLFYIILFTIFLSICFIFGNNYINDLKIYLYIPYILLGISIPIILLLKINSIYK